MRLLRIPGEGDIYNVYGHLINVVQNVQLLPSERVASFDKEVSNIGFITVHGLNEGHIAPYTDIEFQLKNIKHSLQWNSKTNRYNWY